MTVAQQVEGLQVEGVGIGRHAHQYRLAG
jgi:hypothetical protein